MKHQLIIIALLFISTSSCAQKEVMNEQIMSHQFLETMYNDDYFPDFLVDKCKSILVALCSDIENTQPTSLTDLYKLTQASTIQINNLADEFYKNDSEIETGAREALGAEFAFIALAYGFENADVEELIATRDW
jgi:Family of unknown function (DUF5713)